MTPQIHAIFGAGQIGAKLADLLLAQGHAVRSARRSPAGPARPGLTWMRGNATDRAFADEVCRGADVVYNCTNPTQYHKWGELLAPLFENIRDAAGRAGARLVVLDNLYMYEPTDKALREDTPMNPTTHKGELRARVRRALFDAHARGDVRATSGHASDYFGPGATSAAVFGARFFARLARGQSVEVFGDPDLPRSYSFMPDVAAGLAVLGSRPEAAGQAWHLPVPDSGTTRALVEKFAAALLRPAKLRVVPAWMLRVIGVFAPPIGAFIEMLPQWQRPFVVDDSRFRHTFGVDATPLDVAVAQTLADVLPERGSRNASVDTTAAASRAR